MQEKQDIHFFNKRIENVERLLSKLSKENREVILSFKNFLLFS